MTTGAEGDVHISFGGGGVGIEIYYNGVSLCNNNFPTGLSTAHSGLKRIKCRPINTAHFRLMSSKAGQPLLIWGKKNQKRPNKHCSFRLTRLKNTSNSAHCRLKISNAALTVVARGIFARSDFLGAPTLFTSVEECQILRTLAIKVVKCIFRGFTVQCSSSLLMRA